MSGASLYRDEADSVRAQQQQQYTATSAVPADLANQQRPKSIHLCTTSPGKDSNKN